MEKHQDEKLGTAPLGPLMVGMIVPAVIAQGVNVLYNIIDRIYIGHIPEVGRTALTGVGVCFPIITIISAFSAFVGMGGAPRAAIWLGKGNRDMAERILGNGVTVLLAFSLILSLFFQAFKEPIILTFGGSENTLAYAMDYLGIYLWGTVFVQLALGLNMFITSQGKSRTAMLSILIGAIINLILDPVFIFVFSMGVKGAALATVISQLCSCLWIVTFLVSERSGIRIRLRNMRPDWKIIGSVAALGIAPFTMQSTESLVSIVLNSGLQRYGGDLYVGSLTIMQSVMQLIVVPLQGVQQGTQPIISYNFGAHNKERIVQTLKVSAVVIVTASTLSCLATVFFPGIFARMFTQDEALIKLVEQVMPIFMAGIWIFGIQMVCQSAFMGMGQAKISLFLALLRKIILLVPLALALPRFFGVMGIYYAEPIADVTAAVTTGILFTLNFNKIIKKEMGEKKENG